MGHWCFLLLWLVISTICHAEDFTCDLQCQHGGICGFSFVSGQVEQVCVCPQGLSGTLCETGEPVDPSEVLPECHLQCQNGGTCAFISGDFQNEQCVCPSGASGDLCEVVASSTTALPTDQPAGQPTTIQQQATTEKPTSCDLMCQNGGVCEVGVGTDGSDACVCLSGTTGTLCEINEQDSELGSCDLQCQNGGVCVSGIDGVDLPSCVCLQGTTGDLCEVILPEPTVVASSNDPSSQPSGQPVQDSTQRPTVCNLECQHGGTCELGIGPDGGAGCVCPPGMSGNRCEIDEQATEVTSCDLNCLNGGTCSTNSAGNQTCVCLPGASGDLCENLDPGNDVTPQGPTVQPSTDPCNLQCQYGGECVRGNGDGEQHCVCPTGVSGPLCETLEVTPCGSSTCYHGSMCSKAEDGSLYCDCSAISDSGTHYAGKLCQYEATTYCGDGKDYFCVNGGECVSEGSGTYSCQCPEKWTGPSCEFESQNLAGSSQDCTLTCWNGGVCKIGDVDSSSNTDDAWEGDSSESSEHCVCPQGFTGSKCEHEYEECGNGEHMCLHGSKCVEPVDSLNPVWTCECDDSSSEFCQHHRTTICPSSAATNSVYQGMSTLMYCVNDGVCDEVESGGKVYPSCLCPEKYTGPHCELLKAEIFVGTSQFQGGDSAGAFFVAFTFCVLLVLLALCMYMKFKGQSSKEKSSAVAAAHIEDEAAISPMMEEVDFDAPMEDVELL